MSIFRMLQVRRTETNAGPVLLNVTAGNASSLDLDLKATEGTAPYGSQVSNNQISNLRSSNYKGTEEEWQIILRWLLLGTSPSSEYQTLIEQVELVANVAADTEITFTIRQNIVGITHRLGSIRVLYNDTVEIELFDWNLIATEDRDSAERKVQDLQKRFDEQQKTLNKLNTQLQELIEAKKRHEDELLEKFRHLLNSKKAKIRDQMRLLSTAKVDHTTAKKVNTTRGGLHTPAPAGKQARKAGKRKAAIEDDEDEDEEVYQAHEPKMANEDTDTDRDVTHTPDQDTSETETDDGEGSEVKPQGAPSKTASRARAHAAPARKSTTRTSSSHDPANDDDESSDSGFEAAPASQSQSFRPRASQASQSHEKQKTPPELPPKRELPFGKGRQIGKIAAAPAATTMKKPPPVIDDDETDDEL